MFPIWGTADNFTGKAERAGTGGPDPGALRNGVQTLRRSGGAGPGARKKAPGPNVRAVRFVARPSHGEVGAGAYLLRTRRTDWRLQEVAEQSLQITEVEAVSRSLKSDLGLRPIWYRDDGQICAHLFDALLACQAVLAGSSPIWGCGSTRLPLPGAASGIALVRATLSPGHAIRGRTSGASSGECLGRRARVALLSRVRSISAIAELPAAHSRPTFQSPGDSGISCRVNATGRQDFSEYRDWHRMARELAS